jgi:hypothetical protein
LQKGLMGLIDRRLDVRRRRRRHRRDLLAGQRGMDQQVAGADACGGDAKPGQDLGYLLWV